MYEEKNFFTIDFNISLIQNNTSRKNKDHNIPKLLPCSPGRDENFIPLAEKF